MKKGDLIFLDLWVNLQNIKNKYKSHLLVFFVKNYIFDLNP